MQRWRQLRPHRFHRPPLCRLCVPTHRPHHQHLCISSPLLSSPLLPSASQSASAMSASDTQKPAEGEKHSQRPLCCRRSAVAQPTGSFAHRIVHRALVSLWSIARLLVRAPSVFVSARSAVSPSHRPAARVSVSPSASFVCVVCAVTSSPTSPPPLHTSSSSESLQQLSASSGALHLNVPAATPSASSLPSQLHSPAFTAMMASPLASSHHKFPLPGDPGYIKRQLTLGMDAGSPVDCGPTMQRLSCVGPDRCPATATGNRWRSSPITTVLVEPRSLCMPPLRLHQRILLIIGHLPRRSVVSARRCCVCAAYVFLGGSCDPTTWRADIAVPQFTKNQIPFFNPQISLWSPNLIQLEAKAKEVRHQAAGTQRARARAMHAGPLFVVMLSRA